jgi:hypothetical protein
MLFMINQIADAFLDVERIKWLRFLWGQLAPVLVVSPTSAIRPLKWRFFEAFAS